MRTRFLSLLFLFAPAMSLFGAAAVTPEGPATPDAIPAPAAKTATLAANDLLERFVGWLHGFFPGINETLFHWIACAIIIVLAIVLRHVVTNIIFHFLKKMAAKTETTLDDKLFPALEEPVATLIMLLGIFGALSVLQLPPRVDFYIEVGTRVGVLAVVFWGLIRAGAALIDHIEEIATAKQMTVATFMPLIKKTLLVFAIVLSVLVIAQSLGWPVQSFLAGLGIGGLAFALAAQDTIANLFGSFVVVVDQPFKVGDVVRIGSHEGKVEGIGLRSTKIRTGARTLIAIPNKSVASEAITNLTRMPQRKVEQTLGLTYDTTPEQLESILEDFRRLLREDPGVHQETIVVNFAEYGASSLDVKLVWFTADPNWAKHMEVRERINLKIMRAVAARGLGFAFPSQTVYLDGAVAKQLVAGRNAAG